MIRLRITYSMFSITFWLYFLILLWLNLKFTTCVNKTIIEGRVLHGKKESILHSAHAVLIQIIRSDLASHICGSSVLNQKLLLTAAHCFNIKGKLTTLAFAGHEDIRKSSIMRPALRTIVHKNFKVSQVVKNDIALVVLKDKLPLGANVKKVIIQKRFPRGVTGTLAGWGLIDEERSKGTNLLQLLSQKVRGKECDLIHVPRGMFCAGSLKASNPTPSLGDSGSGLITKQFQIIGILSYKLSAYPALPVYTNVSYFYNWIKKTAHKNYCNKR